jgi:deoxycytidylate deaminase
MLVGSKKFQSVIDYLVRMSEHSPIRIHKHACGLVKGGKVLEWSVNTISNRRIGHAEQMILYKFRKPQELKKCTLFVIRVSKTQISDSKPCHHCLQKIREVGIKKIIYSTDTGYDTITCDETVSNHLSCHYKSKSNLKSHFIT